MTVTEIADILTRTYRITENGIGFDVKALDVKQAYGNTRILIKPVTGSGTRWVDVRSLSRIQ